MCPIRGRTASSIRRAPAPSVQSTIKEGARKKDLNNQLFNAADFGDMDAVLSLIEQGADVHARNDFKNTPLYLACINNRLEIVELLLQHGSVVNAKNYVKTTPLHLACKKGHVQIARLLIENGADINSKDSHGNTPLDLMKKDEIFKGFIDQFKLNYAVEVWKLFGTIGADTFKGEIEDGDRLISQCLFEYMHGCIFDCVTESDVVFYYHRP